MVLALKQYYTHHMGLSYTQILDLFIMKILCNINYSLKNGILRGDVMSKTYEFLKECGYF